MYPIFSWRWRMQGIAPDAWTSQDMEEGLGFCLAAIFCTWGSDTGAYFAGKAFGKRAIRTGFSKENT